MPRAGYLVSALLLALVGCQVSYPGVGKRDGSGRERIYTIAEERAFAIARSAIEDILPDATIEEISKTPLRYATRGYRAFGRGAPVAGTVFEVLPLRMQGVSADGTSVTGYSVRINSQSTTFFGQDAATRAVAERVRTLLEETGNGVWVSRATRIDYESEARVAASGPERGGPPGGAHATAAAGVAAAPTDDAQGAFVGAALQPWAIAAACFAVRRDGVVMTVLDAVPATGRLRVRLADGEAFPAAVERVSDKSRLALLRLEKDGWMPEVLSLAGQDSLAAGERVFSFGLPGSPVAPPLTEGAVVSSGGSSAEPAISWQGEPPAAGSAIVNDAGEVVALQAAGVAVIPAEKAQTLFDRPLGVKRALGRDEAIGRARGALCTVEVKAD